MSESSKPDYNSANDSLKGLLGSAHEKSGFQTQTYTAHRREYESTLDTEVSRLEALAIANPIDAEFRLYKEGHVKGFEAIFDPDKALMDLGKAAIADLLDGQRTASYRRAEFGPMHEDIAALPIDADARDYLSVHMQHRDSGVTKLGDTYTLTSNGIPEVIVNEQGVPIRELPK